jgi:hypothetical protein
MNTTFGHQNETIGLSIRQLNETEMNNFCQNGTNTYTQNTPPNWDVSSTSNETGSYFSKNFYLRIVNSGCYYLNEKTFMWSSDGVEILKNSNSTHTFCTSTHLTQFAGGWVVLPAAINFNTVWANASFLTNPIIYSTVIAIVGLYIVMAIACVYFDRKDNEKIGITILDAPNENDYLTNLNKRFYYEIIVFTGLDINSSTNSNVKSLNYLLFLNF